MSTFSGPRKSGVRLTLAATAALFVIPMPALAETVDSVNGAEIDSAVLDFYIESRTQQTADQTPPEQRTLLLDELRDIYLLSTQDAAEALNDDPRILAQIELQTRSLVAQNVATDYITAIEITDEDVQAKYDEQAELAPPLQYKARHILVESQGEAASIIEELQQGGDFEALATEHSTGPSGPQGGDLGWFSPNQMVAPFTAAVVALEDGAYTEEAVQTDFGWHVILREDSRESEAPPLDSVADTIRQSIQQERFQAYLEEMRAAATE